MVVWTKEGVSGKASGPSRELPRHEAERAWLGHRLDMAAEEKSESKTIVSEPVQNYK